MRDTPLWLYRPTGPCGPSPMTTTRTMCLPLAPTHSTGSCNSPDACSVPGVRARHGARLALGVLLDHGPRVRQRALIVLARAAADGLVSFDDRGALRLARHTVGDREQRLR